MPCAFQKVLAGTPRDYVPKNTLLHTRYRTPYSRRAAKNVTSPPSTTLR